MNINTSIAKIVARSTSQGIILLGTAFQIKNKIYATAAHVVGGDYENLVIVEPNSTDIDDYQDDANLEVLFREADVAELDPIRDILLLKTSNTTQLSNNSWQPISFRNESLPDTPLSSLQNIRAGEALGVLSFPHCGDGRAILTLRRTALGAKVLLDAYNIKIKHGILNFQSRPGHSGSPVFNSSGEVVAMLVGTYSPSTVIRIADLNPNALNETTHAISAEYIGDML